MLKMSTFKIDLLNVVSVNVHFQLENIKNLKIQVETFKDTEKGNLNVLFGIKDKLNREQVI